MKKRAFLFLTGGTIYPTLEIAARGRTDFSMAVAGGLCLCLIDQICNNRIKNEPIFIRCAAGSAIITSVEFIIGVIVNIVLKMDVWDYSAMPLNILGQICLPFSLLWFVATIPAMGLCKLCDRSAFLTNN
ncbi:putative ABC transporter permease [Caproiciproducens sp. LBM24188]|nr:hypothetical protein [Oscillospiraceae bacterium]HHV32785.1 hypothetical protein [Clostridiales bacterium]